MCIIIFGLINMQPTTEKKKRKNYLNFCHFCLFLPCKTHTHKNLKEKNHKNIGPIGKMMMMNFIIFHSSSSTEFFLLLFLRLNFLFCFVIPMFLDSFLYFISKSLFFLFFCFGSPSKEYLSN